MLAVSLTIKAGSLPLFKERWGVLAAHCRSGAEPNCLSYELCVKEGTEDSAAGTELLIYERYVTKADLEVTHNASAPFKAFGKWLNEESGIVLAKSKARCVGLCVLCAPRAAHARHLTATTATTPSLRPATLKPTWGTCCGGRNK